MADTIEECQLRRVAGTGGIVCAKAGCPFWRSDDRLSLIDEHPGCAIKYFNLLAGGEEVAGWLLDLRERLETTPTPLSWPSEGQDW